MSGFITGRVFWTKMPKHLKMPLLAIADACNDEGYGYPGQDRIAAMCEISGRQVRSNLKELEKLGYIEVSTRGVQGGGRTSNAYQMNLELLGSPPQKGNRKSTAGMQKETGSPASEPIRKPTAGMEGANRKSSVGKPEVQRRQTGSPDFLRTSDRTSEGTSGQEDGVDSASKVAPDEKEPPPNPQTKQISRFQLYPDWEADPLPDFQRLNWGPETFSNELALYISSVLGKPGSSLDKRTQGEWSYAFLKTCLKSKVMKSERYVRYEENKRVNTRPQDGRAAASSFVHRVALGNPAG